MIYLVDSLPYELSYRNLRNEHTKIINYTDEEFMANLVEITHLACIISYLKELPIECTLGDTGIIHQLIHLMHIPNEPLINLQEIREQFNTLLKLA